MAQGSRHALRGRYNSERRRIRRLPSRTITTISSPTSITALLRFGKKTPTALSLVAPAKIKLAPRHEHQVVHLPRAARNLLDLRCDSGKRNLRPPLRLTSVQNALRSEFPNVRNGSWRYVSALPFSCSVTLIQYPPRCHWHSPVAMWSLAGPTYSLILFWGFSLSRSSERGVCVLIFQGQDLAWRLAWPSAECVLCTAKLNRRWVVGQVGGVKRTRTSMTA